jgi:hypothetical protein
MTLAIGYLFSAATGVPCHDSYHFIHAVRNSADFFASDDRDFNSYDEDSKDETIARMKELLSSHNAVASISPEEILTEINRIAGLKWAKMVKNPTEISAILET